MPPVVICTCSFLFIKSVVNLLWKSHLKIAKLSALPQRNCYFVWLDLLAKVSHFLFLQQFPSFSFSSSTKFANFVEDLACTGFAPHSSQSSIQVLPQFWKALFAVFVCAQLTWNWMASKDEDLAVGFLLKCMTYVWKCKRMYCSVAWLVCESAGERQ